MRERRYHLGSTKPGELSIECHCYFHCRARTDVPDRNGQQTPVEEELEDDLRVSAARLPVECVASQFGRSTLFCSHSRDSTTICKPRFAIAPTVQTATMASRSTA